MGKEESKVNCALSSLVCHTVYVMRVYAFFFVTVSVPDSSSSAFRFLDLARPIGRLSKPGTTDTLELAFNLPIS